MDSAMRTADPAISYRFDLEIDGFKLRAFTKIEGLAAKYDMTSIIEGGENTFVHQLPGRLSFENIKLTRPLDANSAALTRWFMTLAEQPTGDRGGGLIKAYGADRNTPLVTWKLTGVFPVRYQGPSFDANGSSVPTETIELAHTGFRVVS